MRAAETAAIGPSVPLGDPAGELGDPAGELVGKLVGELVEEAAAEGTAGWELPAGVVTGLLTATGAPEAAGTGMTVHPVSPTAAVTASRAVTAVRTGRRGAGHGFTMGLS
ncbi:hypothetical protein [Microbacterium sp. A93]|uniref:hypothetical protein n=1 Tax=Microbacterium sp. A93 TaxID=3450716 RepID=UPI003F43A615